MRYIYTYEEIKKEFKDRNYILITDHKVKHKEKYEYVCVKHSDCGSQFIDWGHFHNSGRGCYYCGRERTEASRRKDLSEYDGQALAESKGFEYVGMSRHDKKIWVQFICPKHVEYGIQEMPYNNMKRVVVGCQHCIGRNDEEDVVLQEMFYANPNIELLEPYQGRAKRIRMRCTIHGIESTKTPYDVISGRGCVLCGAEKVAAQSRTPKDQFVQNLQSKYKNIELVSGYIAKKEYANFYCSSCGAKWTDIAFYVEKRGCPQCNGSYAESIIADVLQDYNINYIPQFSFSDCRDKKPLPFDYYLPDYNILIEYDGEQHYFPVNFGGISDDKAQENFERCRIHDEIKNQYCIDNNIMLMRIPYWEKDNIRNLLNINLKQYV